VYFTSNLSEGEKIHESAGAAEWLLTLDSTRLGLGLGLGLRVILYPGLHRTSEFHIKQLFPRQIESNMKDDFIRIKEIMSEITQI
jgi:hypothetical protein